MAPACQRLAARAGSSARPAARAERKPDRDTWVTIKRPRSLPPRLTVIPSSLPRTIEQEHYDRTQHEIERLGQE
jgi:hypothetical protein